MGRATTSQMLDEVHLTFGKPSYNEYSHAFRMRLLNLAFINDVCAAFPIPEIAQTLNGTLAASTNYYAPPWTSIIRVNNVVRTIDSFIMIRMSQEDFARLGGNLATPVPGTCDRWYLEYSTTNSQVNVVGFPKASTDIALAVQVNRRPETLAMNQRTPLNEVWDEPIKGFFCARFAQALRFYDDARYWIDYSRAEVGKVSGEDIYGSAMMRTLPPVVRFGTGGGGE